MWNKYGKSLVMLLATLVMAALGAYRAAAADGMTASEWVTVVIALFVTVNVWATANIPAWATAKTFVAAFGLVLNLLVGFLTDSYLSNDEIMLLVIQFLGAVGVSLPSVPAVSQISANTRVVS